MRAISVIFILLFLAVSCSYDPVLATYHGGQVTLSQLEAWAKRRDRGREALATAAERKLFLDRYLTEILLIRDFHEKGGTDSSAFLDAWRAHLAQGPAVSYYKKMWWKSRRGQPFTLQTLDLEYYVFRFDLHGSRQVRRVFIEQELARFRSKSSLTAQDKNAVKNLESQSERKLYLLSPGVLQQRQKLLRERVSEFLRALPDGKHLALRTWNEREHVPRFLPGDVRRPRLLTLAARGLVPGSHSVREVPGQAVVVLCHGSGSIEQKDLAQVESGHKAEAVSTLMGRELFCKASNDSRVFFPLSGSERIQTSDTMLLRVSGLRFSNEMRVADVERRLSTIPAEILFHRYGIVNRPHEEKVIYQPQEHSELVQDMMLESLVLLEFFDRGIDRSTEFCDTIKTTFETFIRKYVMEQAIDDVSSEEVLLYAEKNQKFLEYTEYYDIKEGRYRLRRLDRKGILERARNVFAFQSWTATRGPRRLAMLKKKFKVWVDEAAFAAGWAK